MGIPAQKTTLAEYLSWEAAQPGRHEFVGGGIFAMVGGLRRQGRVVTNLVRRLDTHLDGSRCQVFSESMKVKVDADAVLYPDLFVTCDDAFSGEQAVFESPLVIVEVLSSSTQGYDRGEKFAIYRRVATLREYVLVDPDARRIEIYRREDDVNWRYSDLTSSRELVIETIDFRLTAELVFRGIDRPGGAS